MTRTVVLCCVGFLASYAMAYKPQTVLSTAQGDWRVSVSDSWDVLGPFPIHAREQHVLSPSFPLNLSQDIDYEAKWPSAYADTGLVGWSKATSSDGLLEVSFPDVRWQSLRATEGWAVLQHHALLRASMTIYPPSREPPLSNITPNLLVNIVQGSFFAVLPTKGHSGVPDSAFVPQWHVGNIYAMKASPANVVRLPVPPSLDTPTTYDLFLSGDYEIRLFGDPTRWGTEVPKLSINFSVDVESPKHALDRVDNHDVAPTFVDGWAFGEAIGIGLRSIDGWWTITGARVPNALSSKGVEVRLLKETRLAPSQTRTAPLVLTQLDAFYEDKLPVQLTASNLDQTIELTVDLSIRHIPVWDADSFTEIIATYFFATSVPSAFVAVPPKGVSSAGEVAPPLLFLHGAGVPVLDLEFWECAPPRQSQSWMVLPTGRTEWGLDWHGPSTTDAWQSLDALSSILRGNGRWEKWAFPSDTRVVLLGHSNGGQGTWHVASRFPDRVLAAVPAAAYIKSQAYVPLLHSRSAHFVDPFMRAVLDSALKADDNDLFVTNLVDTPILAIHGGDDENVPVWHSRALFDTLKTWNPSANVTFREDPGQPHCYQAAFQNESTQAFIDASLSFSQTRHQSLSFTLTVAVPSESGSLHGFQIITLETPGRLARLTVTSREEGVVKVTPHNVRVFTVHTRSASLAEARVIIDGQDLLLPERYESANYVQAKKNEDGMWTMSLIDDIHIQPSGRMYAILQSPAPLQLVVRDKGDDTTLQAALRLAHSLDVYHKLDTDIIDVDEGLAALHGGSLNGNIVVLGNARNPFLEKTLATVRTPFHTRDGKLSFNGRALDDSAAAVFLHPHPTSHTAVMMVVCANDEVALERALRLFPIRTGLSIPDWLIIGPDVDTKGAAGIQAAGVWGDRWSLNGGMSSF